VTRPMSRGPRLILIALLVVAVAWLGFRAVRAFDQDRHKAKAAAVLSAPDAVTHQLPPIVNGPAVIGRPPAQSPDARAPEREGSPTAEEGGSVVHNPQGQLSYRPDTWLTVVDLQGLEPVTGNERYLVFLRNWAGWTLAGAATPGPDGEAQVRSAAEPRSRTIYEVVVTRAVDDATSVPHGEPLLHWFDGSIAPPRARQFDFARGA
jgi:hypothetical protein